MENQFAKITERINAIERKTDELDTNVNGLYAEIDYRLIKNKDANIILGLLTRLRNSYTITNTIRDIDKTLDAENHARKLLCHTLPDGVAEALRQEIKSSETRRISLYNDLREQVNNILTDALVEVLLSKKSNT